MNKITFTGWKVGFRKVEFTRLLRVKAGLSLSEAKNKVDSILDGKEEIVLIEEKNTAMTLVKEARLLGAICWVEISTSNEL